MCVYGCTCVCAFRPVVSGSQKLINNSFNIDFVIMASFRIDNRKFSGLTLGAHKTLVCSSSSPELCWFALHLNDVVVFVCMYVSVHACMCARDRYCVIVVAVSHGVRLNVEAS